jgi:hypothetical protein
MMVEQTTGRPVEDAFTRTGATHAVIVHETGSLFTAIAAIDPDLGSRLQ